MFLIMQTIDYGIIILTLLLIKYIDLESISDYITLFFSFFSIKIHIFLLNEFFKVRSIKKYIYIRIMIILLVTIYLEISYRYVEEGWHTILTIPLLINLMGISVIAYKSKKDIKSKIIMGLTNLILAIIYIIFSIIFIASYGS